MAKDDFLPGVVEVARSVREEPLLFVSFALYKAFALMVFMEGFVLSGTFRLGSLDVPLLAALTAVCALVCVLFATKFRNSAMFGEDWYLPLLTILMVLGILLLFFAGVEGSVGLVGRNALLVFGMVLLGSGVMGLHVEFGRAFGLMGMMPTLAFGVSSAFLVSMLVLALCGITASEVKWALAFLLPPVMAVLFSAARKKAFPDHKKLYRVPKSELHIPYRFMATSAVQGMALGVPLGYLSLAGFYEQVANFLGYLVAAAAVVAVVVVMRIDFNRSIYQIGFLLSPAAFWGRESWGSIALQPAFSR